MGETFLARVVFGRSVAYQRVRIHDHGYMPFQPCNSGMTPNGDIYITGGASPDYSMEFGPARAFFIHEMAHVWQKQNGILNPIWSAIGNTLRHGFIYSRAYRCTLRPAYDLLDYRIEQQASIVADYYRTFILGIGPRNDLLQNNETGEALKSLFLAVLKKFLDDPSYGRAH